MQTPIPKVTGYLEPYRNMYISNEVYIKIYILVCLYYQIYIM